MFTPDEPLYIELLTMLVAVAVRYPGGLDEVRSMVDDVEQSRPGLKLIQGGKSDSG